MERRLKIIALIVFISVCLANPVFADPQSTKYFDETLKDIMDMQRETTGMPSEQQLEEKAKKEELERKKLANQVVVDNESGFEDIKVKPYKKSQEILLDADCVTYEKSTGIAIATGNVVIRNMFTTVHAPKVEYDETTNMLRAWSDNTQDIIVTNLQNKYIGKYFEYNTLTKHGLFTNVHGISEGMYINGKDVDFMPVSEAIRDRLVKRKYAGKKAIANDDVIARWHEVTLTSCDFQKPHYNLKTKRAIIIPNRATILRKPKLYFSGHMVFQYPFDYVARQKGDQLMPELKYTGSKGAGIGLNAHRYLGKWGMLSASVSYWTDDIFEASIDYRKELLKNLYIFAAANRWYNSDDHITQWRPEWGLDYTTKTGWKSRLYFTDKELVSTQMVLGETRRYNVSRMPEFSITSPTFFKNFRPARLSFRAMYGRYQDDRTPKVGWANRLLLQANLDSNFDVKLLNFLTPFYGSQFQYYNYSDDGSSTQKVLDSWAGVRYKIGGIHMSTRYYRRWVYGKSAFAFDQYADNIYLNQTLSFPLPIGPSWSKWTVALSGYYDFVTDRFPVLNYSLTYNKHCYTWMLWGRREFYGTENLLGLVFYINARPDKQFSIGSNR